MAEFSERLKMLRKEKGLKQDEFAKTIGVSSSSVSNWERGVRKPEYDGFEKLASFFGVSLGYLLGSSDDRHETTYADIFGANCALEDSSEMILNMAKRMAALSEESRSVLGATLNALYEMDAKADRLDLTGKYEISVVPKFFSTAGEEKTSSGDKATPEEEFHMLDEA